MGKYKIEINAKRDIYIKEIIAILELKKYEKQPHLAELLENLYITDLDSGERKEIERYFKALGFLDFNGKLTDIGEKLIETKKALIPERGVYKLYLVNDPVLGKKIIHYKRIKPKDERKELRGIIENFEEYKDFENKEFKSVVSKDIFLVKFIKSKEEEFPKVSSIKDINNYEINLTYTGYIENGKLQNTTAKWEVEVNIDENNCKLAGELELNIKETLSNLLKDFDAKNLMKLVDFNEAKENIDIFKNFRYTGSYHRKLHFYSKNDENDWDIKINIPALPKTEKEADKWVDELLYKSLSQIDNYLTQEDIEEKFFDIIDKSTIPEGLPNFYFSVDAFIENLKDKNSDIYYRIKATQDLLIDEFVIFNEPKDWSKKVIVVDGSNVAWNNRDKNKGDKPEARFIELIYEELKNKGFKKIIIFCDANLKFLVKDKEKYEELEQKGVIKPVPSKTIADYFIIDYAQRYNCFIVSNDNFKDWKEKAKKYGWKNIKTKKFLIEDNEAIIYDS